MINYEKYYETVEPEDQFFDYCLWNYAPVAEPQNKFRSVNLLFNSFAIANIGEQAIHLCHQIRSGLGMAKTVWGVKQSNGKLSWEFYFYDYHRVNRTNSIEKLLDVIKPNIQSPLHIDPQIPYFMFSIDIDSDLLNQRRELDEINVYIGNLSNGISSGICYSLTEHHLSLSNLYDFFDRHDHWQEIIYKTTYSAHLELPFVVNEDLLWPELLGCKTIVVANKKNNDGLYFSRIKIDALIHFLERCSFPKSLIEFARINRNQLDHLLFDVGFDYIMEDKKIKILKSAYYGFF